MNPVLVVLDGYPLTFGQALGGAIAAITLLLFALVVALARSGAARRREAAAATERQRELEERIAALAQSGAELAGRLS